MEKNIYLSSHGTTHLYNLFVDKDRNPPVYPIQGIPDGVQVEIHYKLKGKQMQSVDSERDSLSQINKSLDSSNILDDSIYSDYIIIYAKGRRKIGGIVKRVEIVKNDKIHVFYDPEEGIIENIPNIEYSYEDDIFTAGVLDLEEFKPSSPIDDEMDFELKELEKYFKRKMNGGGRKLKAILRYEGVSQIKEEYNEDDIFLEEDQKIEILKKKCEWGGDVPEVDIEEYINIRYEDKDGELKEDCITKENIESKFYTGSAWDMKTYGFLHSSRPESWTEMKIDGENISSPRDLYDGLEYNQGCFTDQSLLNMLFNGGKKNWDPIKYIDYPGFGRKLSKNGVNVINIYASHCLNAGDYEEHLSFSNVIPFILGKPGLWAHIFKDELLKGAQEEVKYLEDKLKELNFQSNPDNETKIKNLKYKLKMGKKAVLAMRNINRQNLGPVLDTYRQRKKMKASKKKVKRIKRKITKKKKKYKTKRKHK